MNAQDIKYISYSHKEFMDHFRPSGFGSIKVVNEDPIYFTEILCDLCNKEIIQDPKDPDKKIIFVTGTYALWCDCLDAVQLDHKRNMKNPDYAAEYYQEQKDREDFG